MNRNRAPDRSGSPSLPFLAHVRRNDDGSFAVHHLEDHLRAVATSREISRRILVRLNGGVWLDCGATLGELHD
jgi:hypothetical protein